MLRLAQHFRTVELACFRRTSGFWLKLILRRKTFVLARLSTFGKTFKFVLCKFCPVFASVM